jgi:hypothetical protein
MARPGISPEKDGRLLPLQSFNFTAPGGRRSPPVLAGRDLYGTTYQGEN